MYMHISAASGHGKVKFGGLLGDLCMNHEVHPW